MASIIILDNGEASRPKLLKRRGTDGQGATGDAPQCGGGRPEPWRVAIMHRGNLGDDFIKLCGVTKSGRDDR